MYALGNSRINQFINDSLYFSKTSKITRIGVFGMAVMPLLCKGFAKKSCKSHTENAKLGRK